MIVSNTGPLIHLAKIGKLNLLKELFGKILIPKVVKIEVVDRGKEEGAPDAFLIRCGCLRRCKENHRRIEMNNNKGTNTKLFSIKRDFTFTKYIELCRKMLSSDLFRKNVPPTFSVNLRGVFPL